MSLSGNQSSAQNMIRHSYVEANLIFFQFQLVKILLLCVKDEAGTLWLVNLNSIHVIEVLDASANVHAIIMEIEGGLLGIIFYAPLSVIERTCSCHFTILCHFN